MADYLPDLKIPKQANQLRPRRSRTKTEISSFDDVFFARHNCTHRCGTIHFHMVAHECVGMRR